MEDLKKNAEYIEEDRATTIDRILRERGVPKVLTQLIAQKEAAMPSEEKSRNPKGSTNPDTTTFTSTT